MSGDDSQTEEEQFAELVAACDEALEAGTSPAEVSPDAPPELRARFERDVACMKLLRQALPQEFVTLAATPAESVTTATHLGRFELRRELGRGGFGVVWLAHDAQLDRDVALKVPRADVLEDPELRERFLREARAAAALDHPNVVPLYEAGEVGSVCYIASAYCPGTNLAAWLRQRAEPVPAREAALLVATLADGVEHAHSRGVVHRDLKPANVLLVDRRASKDACPSEEGRQGCLQYEPKITDFGLAKLLEGEPGASAAGVQTESGAIVGTPCYMAPEQAGGHSREVGPAADIYALGAILYEVLTGRPPFQGETVLDILLQVRTQEPVPPGSLRPKLPRDLETICLKCLQKEPQRRYGSAEALADDLECWLDGEPIQARPVSTWRRVMYWTKRRPALAALIAVSGVAALALVAVLVGLFYNARLETANTELRAQQGLARHHLYAAHLNLAQRAWEGADLASVLELLEGHRPDQPGQEDLRGFEWHYLWRLCHRELVTIRGHTSPVNDLGGNSDGHPFFGASVAFSPDSTHLATGFWDGTVKVWDARTGGKALALKGHTCRVFSVAFSPDGKHLASAGGNPSDSSKPPGELKVWDAQTGREVCTLKGHQLWVWSVAFSPDGRRLASASQDQTVKVWDLQTGQETLSFRAHRNPVWSVCFSPDDKRLATASPDQTVKVWDAQTGQQVFALKGHNNGRAASVAFSPDGKRLAGAFGSWVERAAQLLGVGGGVAVWDAQTGEEELSFPGHTGPVTSVAFSSDGERLATASHDRTVKVWDAQSGKEALTLKGHTSAVNSVAFSPDGTRLASVSWDGTVKVWDVQTEQEGFTLSCPAGATAVAFSPDGRRLASAGAKEVSDLDPDTGQEVDSVESEIKVWDLSMSTKGQQAGGKETLTLKRHNFSVTSIAFSPDGTRLASAHEPYEPAKPEERWARSSMAGGLAKPLPGVVLVWDAQTGRDVLTLKGHTGPVRGVAFSPDGKRIASASGGLPPDRSKPGEVKVWDAQTGQELLTFMGHTGSVFDVAFSPDGTRLASAGGEPFTPVKSGEVKVWDLQAGKEVLSLQGHTQPVCRVAFRPDGRCLASASDDRTVKVWDATTGRELFPLKGHTDRVTGVAFSPDSKRLASASADGTVRVWDAATGQEVLRLSLRGQWVSAVAFSSDGWRLAAADYSSDAVKVWDATPPVEQPGRPGAAPEK
jgi:WD40 repeat protein